MKRIKRTQRLVALALAIKVLFLSALMAAGVYFCYKVVWPTVSEKGVKALIIEAGVEVKSIIHEIKEADVD